ncbi:MAG TPA: DinB family protein [Asanoa sp.]
MRLDRRLDGLTDVEFLWEPVPGCWTLRQHATADGGWLLDYDEPPPEPPPLTTIAWRLLHLANGNWIYWEHAFGPGARMFTDLVMPRSADEARRYWRDSRAPITAWLEAASDEALEELRPSHDGEPRTAGEVLLILVDEQVHHGAEIALMRDWYRVQASPAANPAT